MTATYWSGLGLRVGAFDPRLLGARETEREGEERLAERPMLERLLDKLEMLGRLIDLDRLDDTRPWGDADLEEDLRGFTTVTPEERE